MYLNMYRAGRLNNPGRTTTPTLEDLAGIIRRRARRRRERKNSLPVALSIDATGTMPRHLLLIIHHARSERQEPVARPGGRIRPGTRRRRQAGARLKKEEAGGKKLGGLEHSTHAVLATSSPVRHQAIITTTAAQRPPGRLRTRISPPPFEDFGESS